MLDQMVSLLSLPQHARLLAHRYMLLLMLQALSINTCAAEDPEVEIMALSRLPAASEVGRTASISATLLSTPMATATVRALHM